MAETPAGDAEAVVLALVCGLGVSGQNFVEGLAMLVSPRTGAPVF